MSLVNTFQGLAVNWRKRKPILGNGIGGLSGPAIKPLALRIVWQVAGQVDEHVEDVLLHRLVLVERGAPHELEQPRVHRVAQRELRHAEPGPFRRAPSEGRQAREQRFDEQVLLPGSG